LTQVEFRFCDALQQLPALPFCIKPSALEETDQQLLLKLVEQRPEFGSLLWAEDKWLTPHDSPGYYSSSSSSGDEHDSDTSESDSEEDDSSSSSSSSEGDESPSSGFGSDDSLEYDDSSGSDSGGPPPGDGGGGGQGPVIHPWWFVPGGHLYWSPTRLSHNGGYDQNGWSPQEN
jgi:hypothetical protein